MLKTIIAGLQWLAGKLSRGGTAAHSGKQPRLPCFVCGKPTRRRLSFTAPGTLGSTFHQWPMCKLHVRTFIATTVNGQARMEA